MFKFSFKERFFIVLFSLAIFGIAFIFSKHFLQNFTSAAIGAISYQLIDALVYWLRHKNDLKITTPKFTKITYPKQLESKGVYIYEKKLPNDLFLNIFNGKRVAKCESAEMAEYLVHLYNAYQAEFWWKP